MLEAKEAQSGDLLMLLMPEIIRLFLSQLRLMKNVFSTTFGASGDICPGLVESLFMIVAGMAVYWLSVLKTLLLNKSGLVLTLKSLTLNKP